MRIITLSHWTDDDESFAVVFVDGVSVSSVVNVQAGWELAELLFECNNEPVKLVERNDDIKEERDWKVKYNSFNELTLRRYSYITD